MPVIIKDIRFWIIAFFLIRLIGITNPPLEVSHNWRQTTVSMAARNFSETDNHILYPRIDIAGEKSGITGMEFPLLNYLIYLLSVVFGYDHWYGRLINLIVSSFGLWYFFRLVKDHFGEKVAFHSAIVLAVSVWFQFSRKIMPDTFAVSMVIASLYYASCYFRGNENHRKQLYSLILFSVMMMLGVLSKLPAGFLGVLLLIPLLHTGFSVKKRMVFAIALCASLVPAVVWYFRWVPHLVNTYGFWHFFMGVSVSQGMAELMNHPGETFKMFYNVPLKFAGFAIFLFGVYNMVRDKNKWLNVVFVLSSVAFLLLMMKSGRNFYHHNYYILPFVPVMALVAGYGLSKIKRGSWSLLLLIVISVEGLANQQHDFKIKKQSQL